jgi:cytochrome c551/c552
MKFIGQLALGAALISTAGFYTVVSLVATAPSAALAQQAASADIQLPAEVAKLRPSTLPGYAIAVQKCAICHSADYVSYQPPNLTQAQWTAEMSKMQHAYGAPISDDEVKQLGAYLAVAYGSAKASDPGVLALSALVPVPAAVKDSVVVASASTGPAINVQALLNTNNCTSCHAIDQQIVGPGFKQVAAKYKGDPQALFSLQSSIRKGGAGRWGQVPMPPYPGLSDVQVKALAEYVMNQ